MPSPSKPDQAVLADAIDEARGDRQVRAAVFCTYNLEPRFFEDHVLSRVLGIDDGGRPLVVRLKVQEALRELSEVLVLYDPRGLRTAEGSLQHEIVARPLHAPRGCAHAKHVLLLLEDADAPDSMVLVTTSANLTRAGWWKNVECADVRRLTAGEATPLKPDLLALLEDLGELSGEDSEALSQLQAFVNTLLPGAGLPRLWTGRAPLARWLSSMVEPGGWLEVVSPYTDANGDTAKRLWEQLQPSSARVMQPVDDQEAVTASATWHAAIEELGGKFSSLGIDRSLGKKGAGQRFVHAKILRGGSDSGGWMVVGSPNLSVPGHAGWRTDPPAANFETAILTRTDGSPWMRGERKTAPPPEQGQAPPEDRQGEHGLQVRLRFDWTEDQAFVCFREPAPERVYVDIGPPAANSTGRWSFVPPDGTSCQPLSPLQSSRLRDHLLRVGGVAWVWAPGVPPRATLIEESGFTARPSRITQDLTPAQILMHWSLLDAEERARQVEEVLGQSRPSDLLDPAQPIGARAEERATGRTMFDEFAGALHAFLILRSRVGRAWTDGHTRAARTLILGEQHDSLGTLLDQLEEAGDELPGGTVYKLVVYLSAKELVDHARTTWPEMLVGHERALETLEARLARAEAAWTAANLDDDDTDAASFRRWVEACWPAAGGLP